jgi:uncharacterized damage-inducible protein DinB
MSRPLLADAFEHHVWATLIVLDVCAGLPPAQLQTNAPGTYGPILDTLRHLVEADRSYLVPLTDGRAEPIDESSMDLAALRAVMDEDALMWNAVIAGDLDPERVVVRHRDDGSDSLAPLGVRLAQALHHGTDHRSQICTALTSLGIEPPEIDVWDYADSQGRLSQTEPAIPPSS